MSNFREADHELELAQEDDKIAVKKGLYANRADLTQSIDLANEDKDPPLSFDPPVQLFSNSGLLVPMAFFR